MLSAVNQSFVFEIGSWDPFLIEQFITKSLISVIKASGDSAVKVFTVIFWQNKLKEVT